MKVENKRILITGGAGFIGSNLCDSLLDDNEVICFDNFSTGKIENIVHILKHKNFKLMIGDIRNFNDCKKAVDGIDYVLHEAALGSVPRSIDDPITTNEVNINGFVNMLTASKDSKVKRFVYAASSSTYGDSPNLPKIEDQIGKPLSPYAVTKYVNELYADVFSKSYGIDCVGLRYFNVFGARQTPDGAYAAVIPLFIKRLINYQTLVVNGDGEHSRDFTYIKNVLQMNKLALTTQNKSALNTVYNTAFGEQTTLNELIFFLKNELSKFDKQINSVNITYGPCRIGDVNHSLASIERASSLLGYKPEYSLKNGLQEAIQWYWDNLK